MTITRRTIRKPPWMSSDCPFLRRATRKSNRPYIVSVRYRYGEYHARRIARDPAVQNWPVQFRRIMRGRYEPIPRPSVFRASALRGGPPRFSERARSTRPKYDRVAAYALRFDLPDGIVGPHGRRLAGASLPWGDYRRRGGINHTESPQTPKPGNYVLFRFIIRHVGIFPFVGDALCFPARWSVFSLSEAMGRLCRLLAPRSVAWM